MQNGWKLIPKPATRQTGIVAQAAYWRVSIKVVTLAGMLAAFSLILTFSRWEKEQPLAGFTKSAHPQAVDRRCVAKTREPFLPLPAGAATAAMAGEGENNAS